MKKDTESPLPRVTKFHITELSLLKDFFRENNNAHYILTSETDSFPTDTRQLLEDYGSVGCHSARGNDLSVHARIDPTGYVRLLWESNGEANEFSHAALFEVKYW